nr:spectrin alpha chain, non-erythrocytic 1-like isoform X2 [Nothobranchius furzeri]
MLGSAHEVQRFHRDADETKEWIEEKNQALNTDNYGHDLASVQALQRELEGFERDLAALGDKVRFLIGTRTRVVSGDTFFMVLVTPPQPFLISNQRGAFLFKVDGGHNLTPEDCLSFANTYTHHNAELLLQFQPQTYLCTLSSSL